MSFVDYGIILIYFAVVIGLGFWYQKRASKNLGAYFLGGKNMHWLPLAMSGSVATFDITGTMWIVSILLYSGNEIHVAPLDVGILYGRFFHGLYGQMGATL
jgi:Na+/proline symporter